MAVVLNDPAVGPHGVAGGSSGGGDQAENAGLVPRVAFNTFNASVVTSATEFTFTGWDVTITPQNADSRARIDVFTTVFVESLTGSASFELRDQFNQSYYITTVGSGYNNLAFSVIVDLAVVSPRSFSLWWAVTDSFAVLGVDGFVSGMVAATELLS